MATTNYEEDQLQQQINRQRVLRQITLQPNPQPRPRRIIRKQPSSGDLRVGQVWGGLNNMCRRITTYLDCGYCVVFRCYVLCQNKGLLQNIWTIAFSIPSCLSLRALFIFLPILLLLRISFSRLHC